MFVIKGLFVSVILLFSFQLKAQQTVPLFYEKVFIHTDRDAYTSGETIWFKAYLTNAQNNKPINYSHNLYVELISQNLIVTFRHVLRLDNGLGNGDFKLPDTLSAGKYRIRAYTNWMRNFGDQFIFEKNITIINTDNNKQPVTSIAKPAKRLKNKPLQGTKIDTLPSGPIIRFFPEGGSMVDDVLSTIAVKAEDEWGRGIPASGQVFASSGRAVAKFTCDSLGMATIRLRPDQSQQYYGEAIIQNQPMQFKLNKVLRKGFVLGVNTIPDAIVAEISCNYGTLIGMAGSDLVLTVTRAGSVYHKQLVHIQSKTSLVQIPDTHLPEGIACITLFDEFGKSLNERLVYVHHANYTRASLSTDKHSYAPKEKVTVKIKLSDTTKTHLSLAVFDADLSPVQPENILSYLTLKSELKGTIEHPERYFDTTNTDRFKQLDVLLLTQGWRNYVWKELTNSPPKITYEVENGISLTGKVRKVFGKKPLAGMSITMFAPKAEGQKLFSATTDSAGRFTMDGAMIFGYQYLNFTSRRADKINSEGENKGHSGGWIQVDSLFQDKLPVLPETNLAEIAAYKTDSLMAQEKRRRKFSFSGNNQLKTVQIKVKSNPHGLTTETHNIGPAEHKDYNSLMHYLLYMLPAAHEEDGGCKRNPAGLGDAAAEILPVLYFSYKPAKKVVIIGRYADNSKIDYNMICDDDYLEQPMINILKVKINKFYSATGMHIMVEVLLKPGVLQVMQFANAMADITGYTKATEFYTPRYEAPSEIPDYRTTIHWEPNITTDARGEATITYYNADPKTKVRLVVQGITDKGMPVVAGSGYEIK